MIAPEALLGLADYRAGQRAFQSVARMREFAADDDRAEVVIQTSEPGHFVIRAAAAGDFPAFYETEIESRRALGYPPFTNLAEVVLQGRDLRTLARKSREFAAALGEEEGGRSRSSGPLWPPCRGRGAPTGSRSSSRPRMKRSWERLWAGPWKERRSGVSVRLSG